jgi:hypothetical protein
LTSPVDRGLKLISELGDVFTGLADCDECYE